MKLKPNPQQQEAINHPIDSPLKVIAGAGTGKTTILTYRFVRLLQAHPDLKPHNILALTFTNKAADEMANRIVRLAKEEGIMKDPLDFTRLWVSTFHSFCGRILRENAFDAGLDPEFEVMDELDARLFFHRVVDDLFNLEIPFNPDEFPDVDFTDTDLFYRHLFDFILHLKDRLISPEEFKRIAASGRIGFLDKLNTLRSSRLLLGIPVQSRRALFRRLKTVERQMEYEREMAEVIYLIYDEYQRRLIESDRLDFADLIFRAYDLLSEEERIKERYRSQFRYILVDEFQDTNEAQFKLLKLLAADERMSNVTVVGDDKQSIYGWRDARVENVEDFRADEWGGKTLDITKNYRSYGEILEVAHHAITRDSLFALKAARLEPELKGFARRPRVYLVVAPDRPAEADFVARSIRELMDGGVNPRDIAVLMRSVRPAKTYEDALRTEGVPYLTVGGIGFYDREEIKDIICLLRLCLDLRDDQAMVRALKSPAVALNDETIYRLRRLDPESLFQAISSERKLEEEFDRDVVRRLVRLRNALVDLREMVKEKDISVYRVVKWVIELSGYNLLLERLPESESIRVAANLRKILYLAGRFEAKNIQRRTTDGGRRTLENFIRYIQFSIEREIGEEEAEVEAEDAVQVMTVHQAKGLEFDVVFVVNAKERVFPALPRLPKLMFDEEDGLLISADVGGEKPFKLDPYTDSRGKLARVYEQIGIKNHSKDEKAKQLREERRVWYVALTRAKERLYITTPSLKSYLKNPPFVKEILEEFEGRGEICEIIRI
jgi:DNA helicase-2/ATP-dependent DNA helicase PcrA